MKKILSIMIILTMTIVIFGCGETTSINNPEENNNMEYTMEKVTDLSIFTFDKQVQFELLSKERGFNIFESDGKYFLFISLGEKRTSGYDIIDREIKSENGEIIITIEEIEPDNMVAQVITYPYAVFELKGLTDQLTKIKVQNNHGELFNEIELDISYETGQFVGLVDPHSIEIITDEKPKTYQIIYILETFNSLNIIEGDKVKFSFIENEPGELIILSIEKVSN